jgi:hypothetical protein
MLVYMLRPTLTRCSLKIHLHRWIIIKACYYIRNMKLKRPSGANEYDTLADMDGDSQMVGRSCNIECHVLM